ncbi:PucR family transcriptional regulator [Nonomuraea sp. NPDC050536]|uniref:PucR family transcriptional regulator n=1 Tax=Nonomuraea sp. NPDC050536 TaxID=3364366 RepID=UPI0037C7590B
MLSELQELVDSLASRLGRSVAIDDPSMALVVYTPQIGAVDRHRMESVLNRKASPEVLEYVGPLGIATATQPVRVPARPDMEMFGRVCVPIRHRDVLLGYLWLIETDPPMDAAEIEMAEETARTAGLVMYREQLLGNLRRAEERETLRDLFSDDPTIREHAVETLRQQNALGSRRAFLAVVGRVLPIASIADLPLLLEPVLHQVTRRFGPASCAYLARADHAVVITAAGPGGLTESEVSSLADLLHAEVAKVIGDRGSVRVGVGDTVESLTDVRTSYRHANDAIKVGETVPGFQPVVHWKSLGIYSLLVQLPLDQLPEEAVPRALRRLFEVDRSGQLVNTLEVYLDHIGDVRTVLAKLHVHRATLYYRLGRVGDLTGLDLADGGQRLMIHLGLKLARLTGRYPHP